MTELKLDCFSHRHDDEFSGAYYRVISDEELAAWRIAEPRHQLIRTHRPGDDFRTLVRQIEREASRR